MTTLVARHNALHAEVLRQLERAGLLDHAHSCGLHNEGWWGHTLPGFVAHLEQHAALGLATELPSPRLHPELLPARDFRYNQNLWGPGGLQVISFDDGRQWYADVDEHAPVDVVGAIGHGIDVIKDRLRGNA